MTVYRKTLMAEGSQYTLAQLYRGTRDVLPTTADRGEPFNFNINDVSFDHFYGTNSVHARAEIKSMDSPRGYSTRIDFYKVHEDDKPSYSKNPVRVACGCAAYKFWFAWPNAEKGAHLGTHPKEYEPVPPEKRQRAPGPPKNPAQVPGACKHVWGLTELLRQNGYVVD